MLATFVEPIKWLFAPMPDDMTSTKYHIKQLERRNDLPVDLGEIVRPATPVDGYIFHEADGPFCPLVGNRL